MAKFIKNLDGSIDEDLTDSGGQELFYRDENGEKQDEALWDDILGDDDQGTWDPSKGDVPPTVGSGETGGAAPSSSPLGKIRALISRHMSSSHGDDSSA